MKLVQILATELKEWPVSYVRLTAESGKIPATPKLSQDDDGFINKLIDGEVADQSQCAEGIWSYEQWTGVLSETSGKPNWAHLILSEDCNTAIVTKEEWEEEKLKNGC